ncbi:aldehyde dehydrogenase (NAD+) [Melghirimyces profundicolus]|uniref:3-sulfolactaldehyde dehydrogenase n=1 Tax=Melghirimyces profundicolus TaxID=1242148 RepID=A0A2T6C0Q2_9BACL|nr:aldehyde dehydrogenase family protein [Melghirimyces profundicolus]PTX61817.1 aldehyde dehydrogenase (NAD+) [Melghirimyces profundicolus]
MAAYSDLNRLFIGKQWRDGSTGEKYNVTNPFNQETIAEITMADKGDVDEAYQTTKALQEEWAKTLPQEKRAILEKAAQIMEHRREELVRWLAMESGSSRLKANVEVDFSINILKEAATFPFRMNGSIVPSIVPGKENRIYRKPVGVVGVISPWNFPLYLSMRSIGPALGSGNSVVVKPPRSTPVTGGILIAKIFEEAGLPAGLLNVIIGKDEEVGDPMVTHPIPGIISFTGSTKVGRIIGAKAGEKLKRVALELGGNNVFIVLDDADLDRAVKAAAFGKFMHQGQICMSINRMIVDRNVYEPFLEKLKERVSTLKAGDPLEEGTNIGPLIRPSEVERIQNMIQESKRQGARTILEGETRGALMEPVILADVRNEMPIAKNEVFGPVAAVLPVDGEEEAVRVANDTSFGLSGSVHAGTIERGVRVAHLIETGMIHVNDQPVNDEPVIAFGGEKDSGLGRFGGEWALDEFTTVKWISVQEKERAYPFFED